MQGDHLQEMAVGGAVGEEMGGECGAGFGSFGFVAEVKHVAREGVGQGEEIGAEAEFFG